MAIGSKVVVKIPHQSNYPNPIKFSKGDIVTVGREDDQYPGWIWTTTASGNSGWAPRQRLQIDGEQAVALADYEATELNTQAGQVLAVLDELNDWYWVRTDNDIEGWVPAETVEPV